jgi:hypothetical protein
MLQSQEYTTLVLKFMESIKLALTEANTRDAEIYTQVIKMLKEVITRILANSAGIPESLTRLKEELQIVFHSSNNVSLGKANEILGSIDLLKNTINRDTTNIRQEVGVVNEIQLPAVVEPSAALVHSGLVDAAAPAQVLHDSSSVPLLGVEVSLYGLVR